MKKKIIVSSIVTIIICLCLIAGSTSALFTSTATISVAVTAANVDVDAVIDQNSLLTWSLGQTEADALNGPFVNGGSADIDANGNLVIDKMTPGDVVKFNIEVTNNSNVAVAYQIGANATPTTGAKDLSEALKITVKMDGDTYVLQGNNKSFNTGWLEAFDAAGNKTFNGTTIEVIVEFPNGTAAHDNEFKNAETNIAFTVTAVQGNGLDANGNLIEG
jgi:predicted ribosomally synthesized peptide with SipW-like signal peptide